MPKIIPEADEVMREEGADESSISESDEEISRLETPGISKNHFPNKIQGIVGVWKKTIIRIKNQASKDRGSCSQCRQSECDVELIAKFKPRK